LFGSVEALASRLDSRPPQPAANNGTHECKWAESDEELKHLVTEERLSLTAAAQRLGITVTTAQVRASAMGIKTTRRPKSVSREARERIREELRKGQRPSDVAAAIGVSPASVYRVLREEPELKAELVARDQRQKRRRHRHRVKRFRRRYPQACLQDLRRNRPALYAWFYRHDHAWLKQRFADIETPRRSARHADWESRDRALAKQVRAEAAALYAANGKPRRVSETQLLRRCNALATFKQNESRFPRTRTTLSANKETIEQTQLRRVLWAVRELRRRGQPVVEWRLRRLAGLRRECANRVEGAVRAACESGEPQLVAWPIPERAVVSNRLFKTSAARA
jgi:hypothetical protein